MFTPEFLPGNKQLEFYPEMNFSLKVKPLLSMKTYNTITFFGSSRPELFCKKGVLRNFTTFKGKHLCQSLFFNKVAGLRPASLLKKRLWHRCFPVNFVKFLRTPFLQNVVTSGRLLLN